MSARTDPWTGRTTLTASFPAFGTFHYDMATSAFTTVSVVPAVAVAEEGQDKNFAGGLPPKSSNPSEY